VSQFLIAAMPDIDGNQWQGIFNTLEQNGGRAVHGVAPNLVVAEGDDATQNAVFSLDAVSGVFAQNVPLPFTTDPLSVTVGEAWNFRQTRGYAAILAEAVEQALAWDQRTGGVVCTPPYSGNFVGGPALGVGAPPPNLPVYVPGTNSRLAGNVAVSVVTVDGPPGTSAAFLPTERIWITLGVLDGIAMLQKPSPPSARLFMMTEYHDLQLAIDPATVPAPSCAPGQFYNDELAIEPLWRDPALATLGFGPDVAGVRAMTDNMRSRLWYGTVRSERAYVVFITKYNSGYFAYTSTSRLWFTIQYDLLTRGFCGGIGYAPAIMGRVFAHETGHIFGAMDEYAPCSTTWISGDFPIPNANCVVGNPFSVPCLMRGDSEVLCLWSRRQMGWTDA
jgi:hypothetical protein